MIKVTEKLYIDADSNCYTVKKYTGFNKNDEPKFASLTYHAHLHEALQSILNHTQRSLVESETLTLKEALESFKTLKNEILGILEVVKESEAIKRGV